MRLEVKSSFVNIETGFSAFHPFIHRWQYFFVFLWLFFLSILFCSLDCTAMSCGLSFTLNILHLLILNVCSVVVFSLLTLPCILFTVFACIQFLSLTFFFYRPFAFDAKSKQWMLRTFNIHRSVCDKSIMKYQKRERERESEKRIFAVVVIFPLKYYAKRIRNNAHVSMHNRCGNRAIKKKMKMKQK